ncbi:MAG: RagB/SusD family nutrient uptake outer membrane protein [Bacteroidetes bacterium]|nr:RagB/SusD family nutrient uptake outer membrane protein [Bacteroidota bacterium]
MKIKINLLLSLMAASVLMGGCTKDLQENPKTFIAPDDFFANASQCTQAVNGSYSSLYSIYGAVNFWQVTDLGTDLIVTADASNLLFNNYTFNSGNTGASGMWSALYTAVKNANMVINRVSQAKIDTALRARLVGETKFLRGLYYFNLSNIFGDVPLWTDELDAATVSKLKRSPVADVRAQIIKDLTEAAPVLPLKYGASDVGRATQGAALALLAKVYLYNKDWANAQATALRVVQAGQYSLLPNYADVFDIQNRYKNNAESVFEVQFKRDPATNNNVKTHSMVTYYMMAIDPNNKTYAGVDFGNTTITGFFVMCPTLRLDSLFEANDNRKNVVLGYGYNGQTFNRWPRPNHPWFGPKFWDLQATGQVSGKDLYVLRYADVLLMLAEAYNEQGNTAGSIQYLNMIRKRAGLADLAAGLSQDDLRKQVMKERGIEFVGEFQRKWDLVRWGKLQEAIQSIAYDNPTGAVNIKPYMNLFPISATDIVINPNLTQNPGY